MNGTERYTKALLRDVASELISATMHLVNGELIFQINSGSGRYRLHKLPETPALRLVLNPVEMENDDGCAASGN